MDDTNKTGSVIAIQHENAHAEALFKGSDLPVLRFEEKPWDRFGDQAFYILDEDYHSIGMCVGTEIAKAETLYALARAMQIGHKAGYRCGMRKAMSNLREAIGCPSEEDLADLDAKVERYNDQHN